MTEKKQSYLKAIATLMSGSVIAQTFTIICAPILTRLFSTETLGLYSLVSGAVTMFGAVTSLRYELCIVSEKEEKNIYPLILLASLICVIMSFFVFCGYCVYFKNIKSEDRFVGLAIWAGLLVFLYGMINIVTAYNNRTREYKLINKTYVKRVFTQNICNIIAGCFRCNAIGLSASHFIGYLAGFYGQVKPLLLKKHEIMKTSKNELIHAFQSNQKQALFSAPATLANGVAYTLISYFMETLYSTSVVGYYSISYRVLGLPMTIISGNISKVFLEKASREYSQKGNFVSSFRTTIALLIVMTVPIGSTLFFLAPWACEVFFGNGWKIAGIYIQILTPMFLLRFIAGGVNTSAIIADKQQVDFYVQLSFVFSLLVIWQLSKMYNMDVRQFLSLINIVFSFIYVVYIMLFYLCAKGGEKDEVI